MEAPGYIKAGPMTKALTLQFMNGFRAYPHFGGKAHISLFRWNAVPFKSGEGNIQLSNICGETGKTQTKLPNSTKES